MADPRKLRLGRGNPVASYSQEESPTQPKLGRHDSVDETGVEVPAEHRRAESTTPGAAGDLLLSRAN